MSSESESDFTNLCNLLIGSIRMSKKIPSDVAEWTQYMWNKSGAVFFILGDNTDEDGRLAFARLVTDDHLHCKL